MMPSEQHFLCHQTCNRVFAGFGTAQDAANYRKARGWSSNDWLVVSVASGTIVELNTPVADQYAVDMNV